MQVSGVAATRLPPHADAVLAVADPDAESAGAFYFVRHGATELNLRGRRCGGDLDIALTDLGRGQAREAALRMRALKIDVRVIVTSSLARAQDSAAIIAGELGVTSIVIEPLFNERRLGGWNLRPISETAEALARHETPPGGEAESEFRDRVAAALEAVRPYLGRGLLVVSSKGVARVLNETLGCAEALDLANGGVVRFVAGPRCARARSQDISTLSDTSQS